MFGPDVRHIRLKLWSGTSKDCTTFRKVVDMIHLIGCGGGGCWTALGLSRMRKYLPGDLVLWDGDVVEERNLERQLFSAHDVGRSTKAQRLRMTLPDYRSWTSARGFFTDHDSFENGDTVFIEVDNLSARDIILAAADKAEAYIIIGAANEVTDSEAWVYYPRLDTGDLARDPRKFAPRENFPESDPTRSCSTVAVQTAAPQTALANMGASWQELHLWYMHTVWAVENKIDPEILLHRVGSGVTNVGGAVFGGEA